MVLRPLILEYNELEIAMVPLLLEIL